ncbi:BglG family transcription antiterminator [Paenibacillus sp. 453mf]|uniref:BglG family transcription antiterminator n=1 Tax=Paenibacillus sp. 453mf TaxID=1761874 RepID=UPI0008E7CBF1|nr:BglG family transcription antiterminator [Paenibacillus sp. 453mf]SFS36428.1 transcriptional antiterminator, BglG family [Paenibacillus sp. 453mf]
MEKPSKRTVLIVRFLLASPSRFITVRELSDALDVSERTIKRELPLTEEWLDEQGVTLTRKPGYGIMLEGDSDALATLEAEMDSISVSPSFSRDERRYFIISELLLASGPIKLYAFASRFKVTEGTLSHDLDRIEEWLSGFNIELVRKPGYGVYVEGNEKDVRTALIHLLHEHLNEYELIHLIRDRDKENEDNMSKVQSHIRNRLLNLVEESTIVQLEKYLTDLEQHMQLKLTDSAFIGLAVHLALAIERMRSGQRITIPPQVLHELKRHPSFSAAQTLVNRLEDAFSLTIPEDETGYITMHLKGAEIKLDAEKETDYENVSFELVRLARDILKKAEALTGLELKSNSRLFFGFINHLGPAVERLKLGLDIRNPLLGQIKEQYTSVYDIAHHCSKVLEEYVGLPIPDAEIGYIALHLGAMLEYAEAKYMKNSLKVLVVCASGIGTSSLLQTRIRKEFPTLHIAAVVSAAETKSYEEQVDLIITTVDLVSRLPVVRVSPLLGDRDIEKVRTMLEDTTPHTDRVPLKKESSASLADTLQKQKMLIEGIQDLLNNLVIQDGAYFGSIDELIEGIAGNYAKDEAGKTQLIQELHEREKLGETILSREGIFLLHCRSTVISKLTLSFLRFTKPITYGSDKEAHLSAAIVLLAPRGSDRTYLEAASEVSKSLIDRPGFAARLTDGTSAVLNLEIQGIMKDLYLRKIEQYTMEVEQL